MIFRPVNRKRELLLRQKRKRHGREDANEGGHVVPRRFHFEIKEGKHDEHRQRDHFLDNLKLVGGVGIAPPTVGRHLEQVFKKGNAPTHEDDKEQRLVLEFQMPIPREGHEDIRAGE